MSAAPTELERLGPYRLAQRIGEGGMGVVHLAVGPEGDLCAVKVLRPWLVGTGTGRARIAREVDSLRRIRGPHVAEVLDADVAGDPPYVVTRYIPGPSLDKVVEDHGPLRTEALRRLGTGLAEALSTVHGAGVVHRDVKPGNVLLYDGQPVLIDFGLALALDETRLTATGYMLGTPSYVAPEIVEGQPPTTQTDVHGWGVTLAYAATGRRPYGTGPDSVVLDRIRRGEYDLTGIESWLERLVRKALANDPKERPSLVELQRVVSDGDAGAAVADPFPGGTVIVNGFPDGPADPDHADAKRSTVPASAADSATAETVVVPNAVTASPAAPGKSEPAQPGSPPSMPAAEETARLIHPPTRIDMDVVRQQQPPASSPYAVHPEVRPGQPAQPPHPGQPYPGQPAAPLHPGQPAQPSRLPVVALLAAIGALLAGLTAVVPYVGALALGAALLTARTTWRIKVRMHERRMARGPQSSDGVYAAFTVPWHALVASLPTVVQLGFVILVGRTIWYVGTGDLWYSNRLVSQDTRTLALLVSVATVLLAWFGPGSRRVRRGGQVLTEPLRNRPKAAWIIAGVCLAGAWALGMWWETSMPSLWPLEGAGLPGLFR